MTTVLLGPVRRAGALVGEVRRLREAGVVDGSARIATITAGWQEWEDQPRPEVAELARLGERVVDLGLYHRAERVWAADPELAAAHHEHQRRLRLLRRSYNLRLEQAADAWLGLERLDDGGGVIAGELASACEAVQALDRHHLGRIAALRAEFDERWRPVERLAAAGERAEIERALDGVELVLVAGGHVPLLLNRLRLFDLAPLLAERSVVAWAGGAMALAERVVLFHDSPPWGPGHAEVGEAGLGRVRGVVVLPDGGRRLRLRDPARVARLARRFAPDTCLVLDPGARVEWRDAASTGVAEGVQRLGAEGSVAEAEAVMAPGAAAAGGAPVGAPAGGVPATGGPAGGAP